MKIKISPEEALLITNTYLGGLLPLGIVGKVELENPCDTTPTAKTAEPQSGANDLLIYTYGLLNCGAYGYPESIAKFKRLLGDIEGISEHSVGEIVNSGAQFVLAYWLQHGTLVGYSIAGAESIVLTLPN